MPELPEVQCVVDTLKPVNLKEIEEIVREYALQLQCKEIHLPTFGRNDDFARPEVRVDALGYHYIIIERGQVLEHKKTKEFKQLILWIFRDITFSMACDYELKNRIESQDFRIILFKKQIELLSIIDSDFAETLAFKNRFLLEKENKK